jgi:hypothetical protein
LRVENLAVRLQYCDFVTICYPTVMATAVFRRLLRPWSPRHECLHPDLS